MKTRQQLRAEIRQRRNKLAESEQQLAANQLVLQLSNVIAPEQSVALYLTNDGEIDTGPLIEHLRAQCTPLLFPVLHPFCKGYLNFQLVDRGTKWVTNQYGIAEPALNATTIQNINDIDIILMPLVAFDKTGNRLGMGGGYYDRTLSILNNNDFLKQNTKRPLLIGLAHDCQQVDELPFESWDVPIDRIVTPTQHIITSNFKP